MNRKHVLMPFALWEYHLYSRLVHPDAIYCVAHPDVINAWWKLGCRPQKIADTLNQRYREGYLERKAKLAEAKARGNHETQE